MFNKKKLLAAAVLLVMVILQLQPFLNTGNISQSIFSDSFQISPQSSGNESQVSVFIPPSSSFVHGILAQYLSLSGIKLNDYGLLSSFQLPSSSSHGILGELSQLEKEFGISYYISNSSAVAYPASYGSSIAFPSQSTPNEYLPADISKAYNFTYPLSHGLTGKGTTIAIVDAYGDPLIRYDVSAFDNLTGLPSVNLSIVYPGNSRPTQANSSWATETAVDVEWAHALAPDAKILLVVAQSANVGNLDYAVSYIVSNHLADIVSLSWGIPENQMGAQQLNTFSQVYKYAADSGITILAATGDNGAYDQQNRLTVNFPSSSPYVLAIGGTSLYPVNNHYEQSAWGGVYDGSSYGSGGGYSSYFSTPWWQVAPGFDSSYRGTPDVSMNANKNTGMLVIYDAKPYKIGGTSIAAPIWADIISLMDQSLHTSLGFVNPLLYQLANSSFYKSVYEDITSGNNGYYNATSGWDAATGIGTPLVGQLINATQKILEPYGAVALVNGTGYNSSGITVTLNITGSPENETYNGSTFYYVGSYFNTANFAKFGIRVNNTSVSEGYIISQDGVTYQSFTGIGSYNPGVRSYNLSLNVTGQYYNFTENGHKTSLSIFLENSGMSRLSFGTEQIASGTDMVRIPFATFTGVAVQHNGTSIVPNQVYETHYSGTGVTGYSTIQIGSKTTGNYTVSYSGNPQDKLFGTTASQITQILYRINYSSSPMATFKLLNNPLTTAPKWYVNGVLLSGKNYTTFHSGGVYNITAVYGTGSSITRYIVVPSIRDTNLTVKSPVSYDSSPSYSVVLNHLYSYSGTGKISIPLLSGSNNISVSATGYEAYASSVQFSDSTNVTLSPLNVRVSVYTFPSNALVTVNGNSTVSSQGMHSLSMSPQTADVSISATGYEPISFKVDLQPGQNYSRQETLIPVGVSGLAVVNGNVSDKVYSFHIGGVKVSNASAPETYTNSTGYFIMFLKPGNYNISFSQGLYTTRFFSLNITGTQTVTLNVKLSPKNANVSNIPSIQIGRAFPLLFYFGYLSWNRYTGPEFSEYQLTISTSHTMSVYRTVTISNQNTTFTFLTGIIPGKTYYITISVFLTDGEIYNSNIVNIGYSNPIVLLANMAILIGIIVYAVMAMKYIGRMRKKREIKL